MNKLDNVVAALNLITEKTAFEIYIPSLKRVVKFKPLTAKQQKTFYSCVDEIPIFNTQFIIVAFNIIKENCTEVEIINSLNVIDRLAILLAIRINTLGNTVDIEKDGELYSLNLQECLNKIQNITLPSIKTVSVKNIQLELQVPTLIDQYGLEKELREGINSLPAKILIESLIIGEVGKLIKEIYIDNTPINYAVFSHKERIEIVEKLPAEIIFELQSYAAQINNILENTTTFEISENNKVSFDITPDFFLDK